MKWLSVEESSIQLTVLVPKENRNALVFTLFNEPAVHSAGGSV